MSHSEGKEARGGDLPALLGQTGSQSCIFATSIDCTKKGSLHRAGCEATCAGKVPQTQIFSPNGSGSKWNNNGTGFSMVLSSREHFVR